MDVEITELEKKVDDRGFLVEFLKQPELKDKNKIFGQIYFVTFTPNAVRGHHYHRLKDEWFGIAQGRCEVVLEDVKTKEKMKIILDSNDDKIKQIRIGPNIVHTIKNLSNDISVLIAYGSKSFKSEDPDTYPYELGQSSESS